VEGFGPPFFDKFTAYVDGRIWAPPFFWTSLRLWFCVPATSAPVERVDLFSQNGLTTRPRTAKMSDTLLESLFLNATPLCIVCIVAYGTWMMNVTLYKRLLGSDDALSLTLLKQCYRQARLINCRRFVGLHVGLLGF
jgi:hypothetical protein